MSTKIQIANILRWFGRVLSIIVIPITLCFIAFAGLQIGSGDAGPARIFIYLLLVVAILGGLVVAWWKEGLGAIISLGGLAAFMLYNIITEGFAGMLYEDAPLAGAIHLVFALAKPGYHADNDPLAKLVPWISWFLLLAPGLCLLVSWLLRREKA
jgi:hypothetical protein